MNAQFRKLKLLFKPFLFLAFCALQSISPAQESIPDFYKGPGIDPNRSYVNQHFNEHIDPFNGSLQLHYVDINIPGNGGFDLQVTRSYNSASVAGSNLSRFYGAAGLGWTIHYARVIYKPLVGACGGSSRNDVLNDPVLELPDGSTQLLAFTGGAPNLLSTQRWSAECNAAGMIVRSPDGVRYDMTQNVTIPSGGPSPLAAWYTTKITDRNNNSANIFYSSANSLEIAYITTNDGRRVDFSYFAKTASESTRRISTVTSRDSTGDRIYTYAYQAVPSVLGAFTLTSVTRPDGAKWQYRYFASQNAAPGSYLLSGLTYPDGGTIDYSYGTASSDYVYFDTVSNSNDPSTVIKKKTTSDGGIWNFSYLPGNSANYDVTTVNSPSGTVTYKHIGPNFTSSGTLWSAGLLVQKQTGTNQIENYTWTSQAISYQQYKRPGAWLATRFDSTTNAPVLASKSIQRDGATYSTTFSNFDSYGNPKTVAESGPNGGSRSTSLTYYYNTSQWIVRQLQNETITGVGSITRNFDAVGNLLSENRDGVATGYTRLASGDIGTITRPRGLISTYSNYYRGIPQNESHPEGVQISRIVTDSGNISSQKNGDNQTTSYQYDGLNRLSKITTPTGNPTTLVYGPNSKTATRGSLTQSTVLDGFSRVTSVTTGGKSITTSFDSLGRKIFSSIIGSSTVGHSFQYDILDRVIQITHNTDSSYRSFTYSSSGGIPTLAVRDERGFVTTHAYRAYGDPDQPLVMNITAPISTANVALTRNGRGLVTSATQAGITRTFNYDSRYYLTSTVHPEVGTTTYGRDDAGNMVSKTVGTSGTTIYDYDGRNRLWRVTSPNGSPSTVTNTYSLTDKLRTVTNAAAVRTYGYDANQNLTSESLVVDGLTLAATYNYNATDQLSSIVYPVLGRTIQFNPNALGQPTSVVAPAGSMFNVTFWPNGQTNSIAFAGGSRVTYGQNTREWLNAVTVKTGDNISRVASTLTYDKAGNVTAINDSVDASYNRTLAFDAINRLTTINGPWGSGAVAYNGANNITSYTLGSDVRAFTYDSQNRLSSVSSPISGTTGYGYDVYGNALPSGWGYTYDNASNLIAEGSAQANSYDGTNTRVKTVIGSAITYEFRSAHGLLLAEWRKQAGSFDTLKEHIHVAGKEVAEQRTDFQGANVLTPSWMFLQSDANGSPLSATAANGTLLFKENYQPYGSQLNGTAVGYTQRGFAGRTQDAPNLVYMGGRYYNPIIGRFLSIDPKEADPSDLHSLNRYAYANNNPYRYVDPDGYTPVDLAFFAVDAVKLGAALYFGGDVGGATVDLAISAAAVFSPIPGVGQAIKGLRVADKAVEGLRAADKVVDSANAAKEGAGAYNRYKPGANFSKKTKNDIAEQAGNKCEYCGVETVAAKKSERGITPPRNEAQTDHIKPRSEGGTNAPSNAAHACRECNRDLSNTFKPSPRQE